MSVARDRSNDCAAAPTPKRVRREPTQHSFDDRRCAMFGPDRHRSFLPLLAEPTQRRNEHVLDEVDDGGTFLGEPVSGSGGRCLVASQQRLVHPLGSMIEPPGFRRRRPLRSKTRLVELGHLRTRDEVAAIDHLGTESAATYPAVRGLVVHAEFIGGRLQVELLIDSWVHATRLDDEVQFYGLIDTKRD